MIICFIRIWNDGECLPSGHQRWFVHINVQKQGKYAKGENMSNKLIGILGTESVYKYLE